ncbi:MULTISPECIES: hypothetical protein [Janibacter]|uniref:Secreted protein n=1 Tax=Janibacter hoylei PVAS-1 TaxID=1210046 RepID=A0A444B584_9MICO|nr:hypothetical protein [Janibacter hoylei]MCT1618551.1 hypothetical protein [Janibacter hoylei]MCT2293450.1 hypothetical protein [Janibacter hoylei]MCW4600488.1 hypothetical protein [Janibacter hoylei]RWU83570.1 hypothetical protein CWN80_07265 [Janibacter hoylei PVAS-1]
MTAVSWIVVAICLVLVLAWYLSYSAARLDRLHAKVEGALSALDAHVVRRAEASLELVNSGAIDPASGFLIAAAASQSLERVNEHTFESDLLEGQHFAGRESVESELTEALLAALPPEVVLEVTSAGGPGAAALDRVREAGLRVQLARRFHNDAVKEVQRVRAKRVVRVFRLAGHADLPQTVEFDDALPSA